MYEDSIHWAPVRVKDALWEDDLYVQLTLLIVACWLHAIRKRGMSNPNPFFMVFIINFNVLKVYDKETERFVKRIVKIEIYIIF